MRANVKTLIFTAFILLFTHFSSWAQPSSDHGEPKSNKESSPYSRYGFGDLSESRNAILRGLGGAATAYNNPFTLNSFNPASYSFLKNTTLDFALEARSKSIFMNDVSSNSGTATISYLAIGVPMGKHVGLSFGFNPLTNVYYNSEDTIAHPAMGRVIRNYSGDGGMQYAYLGASGQFKGLSIGVNAGYAFGNIRYTSIMESIDSVNMLNSDFSTYNNLGGIYWKMGAMYQIKFTKLRFLDIGATATLSQSLNIKRDQYATAYKYGFDNSGVPIISTIDTIPELTSTNIQGKLNMPSEYSFGLFYSKQAHWGFGGDFVYTDWKNFGLLGQREGVDEHAYRLSLGGEVTPNPEEPQKYFPHITYRLGFYYGKDYIRINNTDINYIGGTVGASFPLRRTFTQFGKLHTSLDLGRRGTITNGLAREFFVKFTIGISLNDRWFHKQTYD